METLVTGRLVVLGVFIMNIRYVSFDVYDTLIKRILSPYELYKLMESKLEADGCQYGENFAKHRIEAERRLKTLQQNYTLQDIYDTNLFVNVSEREKEKLCVLEAEYEIQNTVPSYYGQKFYEKCHTHYPVICISDMYLSSNTIEKILEKNGYHDIQTVYVSCEYGKSKRDKGLYHIVLKDLKVNNQELLHIGDAKRSDYLNSKMLGIKSQLVRKVDKLIRTDDYYFDFGFNILGPIIYEFCLWIHESSHNQKLLFVSREGEFLKKVYDILFSDASEMLHISRISLLRGTAYVLLQSESIEYFISIVSRMGLERKITLEKFFQRLGIRLEKYESQMMELHLGSENVISRKVGNKLEIDESSHIFFRNVKQDLLKDLEEKNCIFDQYISSKLSTSSTLVDIGWRGTMQDILERYVMAKGSRIELKGVYLGVLNAENKKNYKGFLFDGENDTSRSILNFSGLLEILMMPEYGSVTGYLYNEDESQIIPNFDASEFDEISYKKIEAVQTGVKELVKSLMLYKGKSCFNHETILRRLIEVGCSPSKEDIDKFSLLHFYENGESVPLVENFTMADIRKPAVFKKAFQDCKWKAAFFRKTFKIKLPYNTILSWGRKILG